MIIDNNNILGESPIWNYMNKTFYWVDICDKKLNQ
jgi:sugar lactone lactonase YvrE